MKKGQITLFVVLGIVIAILIVLSFVFKEGLIERISETEIIKSISMSEEARKVQSDMKECMEDLAYESLIKIGLQGGYLDLGRIPHTQVPEALDYLDYEGTTYVYYQGQNKVPSLTQMQSGLAKDLTTRSTNCKKEYEDLSLSYGRVVPKIEMKEDKIRFNINWVVDVEKEGSKSRVKYVNFEIPLRLGRMRDVVDEIVEGQEGEVCLSCLTEIGFENGMTIDIEKIDEDIFYLITDEKSKIRNENYIFLMANKF